MMAEWNEAIATLAAETEEKRAEKRADMGGKEAVEEVEEDEEGEEGEEGEEDDEGEEGEVQEDFEEDPPIEF